MPSTSSSIRHRHLTSRLAIALLRSCTTRTSSTPEPLRSLRRAGPAAHAHLLHEQHGRHNMQDNSRPHGGINARAQTGFSDSAAYDQHRPSYPPASVHHLLEQIRLLGKHHARVLDLAAGTGKFTQALVARDEQFEVVALEPHDGMRQVLADKGLPGVTVLSGTAESIPADDASFDAVIAAQAFHWFANPTALQEIHRVLKPHGAFGMTWNIEQYNAPRGDKASTAWEAKLHELTWTFHDDEPRFRHEKWRKVFDDQIKSTPLSLISVADPLFALPLGEHREQWAVWLPKDRIWERYNTLSHIAVLEGEDRERTHKVFLEAINSPEVETNDKGEVAVHGTTYSVWTTKVPAEGRQSLTDVE